MKEDLNSGSSLYFKPKDGENRIRVVTEPVKIWKSFNKATKTAKVYVTEKGAKTDQEAKPRFLMHVLNRDAGNQLQIAEFGSQVMSQFLDLATSSEYGFASVESLTYDFILMKKGAGMETEYTLQGSRRESPLTSEEREIARQAKPIMEMLKEDKAVVDLGGELKTEDIPFYHDHHRSFRPNG